jgi:predicted ester cyclase
MANRFPAEVSMSAASNSAAEAKRVLLTQLYDGFLSGGDRRLARTLFSANLRILDFPLHGGSGIQAAIALLAAWRQGFPDLRCRVEAMVIEGAYAMTRFLSEGSHAGNFCGIDPTGRRLQMRGADFFTFEHGKIVEWRYIEDRLSLAVGLGLAAPPLSRQGWPLTLGNEGLR